MEEATVVVEVIQDQPAAAPQGLMAAHQYAQALARLGQALAEPTAVAPSVHHERAQHGRAARYDKNRAQ